NIDSLVDRIKARGDSLQVEKQNEKDWGEWATKATNEVEEAVIALGKSHSNAGEEIRKFAEMSRKASGGISEDVEGTTKKANAFAKAMEDLDSVGANWSQTLEGIDGEVVAAARYYLDAGVSLGSLRIAYGLTEAQARALEAAH